MPAIETKNGRHGSGDITGALSIGLLGLISAYEHGYTNRYEIADYLDVTEEYLEECIHCYRDKYSVCRETDNYVVYFIPNLTIFKKL